MVKRTDKKMMNCPCGEMGQSCIVARRHVGDFVHVDHLMKQAKVSRLKHCLSVPNERQQKVLDDFATKMKDGGYDSITFSS